MIVTCKVCNTRYRLDPDQIKGEEAKVRCSNCGEVFTISKPIEEKADPQLLSKVFQEEGLNEEEETFDSKKKGRGRARKSKSLLRWSLASLVILVAAGAVFLFREHFYPAPTKPEQMAAPPAIISIEDPAIKNIKLADAEGYFKENKEAGTIFVIKGAALNQYNRPVSFIRLRGLLHDANAQKVKEEEVFAGNTFTEDEILTLPMAKIRERSQNKYGVDKADYQIPPGKTVPFMIVFDQIPHNLAEFTVRVVGGQSETATP